MPIPKRRRNEKKDKFISRCMGDDTMVKDYPDSKQRAAICYKKADERKETKSGASIGLDDDGNEFLEIKIKGS